MLVAGGVEPGSGLATSAEIYDPIANTWTPTVNMVYGRQGAAAVLLQNGIVLVAGGDINGSRCNLRAVLVTCLVLYQLYRGATRPTESSYVFFTSSSRGVIYADRVALIE